ncbi:hypothetical protein [Piscinibacter sp.]|uniref:hypothetical protein n=1 Tax=Piscinibacter sp. TaxID=1903157 RepID=UPI0039E27952
MKHALGVAISPSPGIELLRPAAIGVALAVFCFVVWTLVRIALIAAGLCVSSVAIGQDATTLEIFFDLIGSIIIAPVLESVVILLMLGKNPNQEYSIRCAAICFFLTLIHVPFRDCFDSVLPIFIAFSFYVTYAVKRSRITIRRNVLMEISVMHAIYNANSLLISVFIKILE